MALPKLRYFRHEKHEDLYFGNADVQELLDMLERMPDKIVVLIETDTDIRPILGELSRSRATTPLYQIFWSCRKQKLLRFLRCVDMDCVESIFIGDRTREKGFYELYRQIKLEPSQVVRDGYCGISIHMDFLANSTVISYDLTDADAVDIRMKLSYILCDITDYQ